MNHRHFARTALTSLFMGAFALACSPQTEASPAQPSAETEAVNPAPTRGLNHIGLTVRDLDASAAFFTDALRWRKVGGDPDYPSVFVTDGVMMVSLWRATDPENATAFDRKSNIGLHHMAMTIPDLETLDELYETLKDWPGVEIEFAPEFMGNGPTTHMIVYEPSGSRIEFVVPRGRRRGQTD